MDTPCLAILCVLEMMYRRVHVAECQASLIARKCQAFRLQTNCHVFLVGSVQPFPHGDTHCVTVWLR